MGKKQSPVRLTFLSKIGQPAPTYEDVLQNNILFTEYLPLAASGYYVYFLLELKRVDVHLQRKRMNFYKETLKKTQIILYRTKDK